MLNIFKVSNEDTRTPLAFKIFDSIRDHSISSAFKNMGFQKGRRCYRKKVTKSKIGSKGFNLTKKWFQSTDIWNQSSMFVFLHIKFSCSDNITPRNSKTECYKELHFSRFSEGLSTGVASVFMRGGRKSDIMDFLFYHEP